MLMHPHASTVHHTSSLSSSENCLFRTVDIRDNVCFPASFYHPPPCNNGPEQQHSPHHRWGLLHIRPNNAWHVSIGVSQITLPAGHVHWLKANMATDTTMPLTGGQQTLEHPSRISISSECLLCLPSRSLHCVLGWIQRASNAVCINDRECVWLLLFDGGEAAEPYVTLKALHKTSENKQHQELTDAAGPIEDSSSLIWANHPRILSRDLANVGERSPVERYSCTRHIVCDEES